MSGLTSSVMNLAVILSLKNQMGSAATAATGQMNQISTAARKAGRDLDDLKAKSRAAMTEGGMQMGMGAAAFAPLAAVTYAYARQEEAGAQLKMSMMDAGGTVRKEFQGIQDKATELGNRLKGSTSDFLRLADTMTRLGVSGDTLLKGGLEAAAYLGVTVKIPYEQAGESVAKFREAMGVADSDLLAFMDDIQRMSFVGVDMAEMSYAFGKVGSTMKGLGMSGLKAARDIEPLIGILIKANFHGEEAGTSLGMLMTQVLDPERVNKANKALAGTGVSLRFADRAGKFLGVQNMVQQLEKLQGLSDVGRLAVLKDLTGGGGDQRVASVLIEKGLEGYRKMTQAMKEQADIKTKAGVMNDTLAQQWENLTGTVENLAAAVGSSLKGAIGGLLTSVNSVVGALSDFARSNPELFRMLATLAALAGTALTVAGAVKMIGGAWGYANVMVLKAFGPLMSFFQVNAYSSTMAAMGVTRMAWTWTVLKMKILQAGTAALTFLRSAKLGMGVMLTIVGAILTDSMGVARAVINISTGWKVAIVAVAGVLAFINPILGLSIAIAAVWDRILYAMAYYSGDTATMGKIEAADIAKQARDLPTKDPIYDESFRAIARRNYDKSHGAGAYEKEYGVTKTGAGAAGATPSVDTEAIQAEIDKASKGIQTSFGNAAERGVSSGVKKATARKHTIAVDVAGLDKLAQFERYAQGAAHPAGMPEEVAKYARHMNVGGRGGARSGAAGGGGAAQAHARARNDESTKAARAEIQKHRQMADNAKLAWAAMKKAGVNEQFDHDVDARMITRIENGMSPEAAAEQEKAYQKAAAFAASLYAASPFGPSREKALQQASAAEMQRIQSQKPERAAATPPPEKQAAAGTARKTPVEKNAKMASRTVSIQNLNVYANSGQEGKATARTIQKELRHAVEMG